jgi:hypothetical protein
MDMGEEGERSGRANPYSSASDAVEDDGFHPGRSTLGRTPANPAGGVSLGFPAQTNPSFVARHMPWSARAATCPVPWAVPTNPTQLIPSHPIQTAHARDGDGLTRPASSSKVLTDVYRPTPHRPPVHRLGLPTRSMRTQPRATRGMLFTFLRRSWGGRRRQVWTPQNRGPACRGSVANPQPARASRK